MEIAEDVKQTADEIANRWIKHQTGQIRLNEVIARAIMAERERCAAIARNYGLSEVAQDHSVPAVAWNAGQNVAEAIRAP